MKKLYCFIAIAVLICTLPVRADALTQGQKSIGDIGVNITWFDFGQAYKDYYIRENMGTDIYNLTMSNDSTGVVKTGFVNGKGELLIEPATEESSASSGGGDWTIFTSRQGDSLIYGDADGIRTIDFSPYSSIDFFRGGYATVTLKSSEKKAVIDKYGNLIFEDKNGRYKGFTYLGSGIFAGEIEQDQYDFLDNTGSLLSKTVYTNEWLRDVSEERLSAAKDGKYGFLDLSANEVIPFIYDEAYSFQEGLSAVCKDGKWGFIDKDGMEVISTVYDQVDSYFHNGLAAACLNGKWGLIDKGGNAILPFEYDDHIYAEEGGFHIARKDGKTIILDGDGNLISDEYSYMRKEPDDRIYVSKNVNGSEVSAYLDQDNKILTGFKEFLLYPLGNQLYLGKKSGDYPPGVVPPHDYSQKFAILDSDGNNLTGFKYSNVRWGESFQNGFQVVNRQYYETAGLVNQYGAEVLPTIFEDIILTKEGYAFVTINDPDVGGNSRVGYFKIPDQFAEVKGSRPITVYLDGIELYFDSEPVIKNQRTMAPLRKIFESLGQQVEWDESAKTITAKSGDQTLKLTIGSNAASVNGTEVRLDAEPFIQDDRTLVPLRFVAEHLGVEVQWDDAHRRVVITSNGTI